MEIHKDSLAHEIVRAIAEVPLQQEPCDHVQFWGLFPPDVFEEMLRHLPEPRFYVTLKTARTADGLMPRTQIIMMPAIIAGFPREQREFWSGVVGTLRSPLIATAFQRKFADALSARFGLPATDLRIFPYILLVRDLPGYSVNVHRDSRSKAITSQFYLPSDDERAYLGTNFFARDGAGNDTLVKTIPFVQHSGYAFPVSDDSWHGVARLAEHEPPRHSLMLTYYVTPHLAKRIGLVLKGCGQTIRARSLAVARRIQSNPHARP